jgi:hypothetical protein
MPPIAFHVKESALAVGADEVEEAAGLGGCDQRLEQPKPIVRKGLAATRVPNRRAIN